MKARIQSSLIDGEYFGEDKLDTCCNEIKNEIIGDVLGLLMAPITNVVSALNAQGSNLVGAVKTIAEKGEN